MVLDLTFDDGTTRDVSGSRQAISVNGNTQFGDGLRGEHSFAFDGSTIIQVADDPSLRVENGFTQSAWIKIDLTASGEMNIAEKGSWTGDWLSHLKVADGLFYYAFAASTFTPTNVDDGMRNLQKGRWIHVAMTWDGTARKLYVDGVLDGEDHPAGMLRSNRAPIEIGGRSGGSYMFNGLMDEFKLFNRALTAEEVSALGSTA